MQSRHVILLDQGLQITVRRPNPVGEIISHGPRTCFIHSSHNDTLSIMKRIIYSIYEKFDDLVEYNISRNSHIT